MLLPESQTWGSDNTSKHSVLGKEVQSWFQTCPVFRNTTLFCWRWSSGGCTWLLESRSHDPRATLRVARSVGHDWIHGPWLHLQDARNKMAENNRPLPFSVCGKVSVNISWVSVHLPKIRSILRSRRPGEPPLCTTMDLLQPRDSSWGGTLLFL